MEFLWLSNGASFGLNGDQYFIDYPFGYLTETRVDYIRVWKQEDMTEVNDSLLNKNTWELIKVDSEDKQGAGNRAINAFDGNPYSFWFTDWANDKPEHPHEIQIDLGDTAKIYAFKYLPRQDGKTNGNIVQYQFFAGNDSLNWGEPIVSGTFSGDNSIKTVTFGDTIECKYIRLIALSDINDTPYTNVAELCLMGHYISEETNVPVGIGNLKKESNIKIFPNPFSKVINLRFDSNEGISNWRVYSIDGRLLKEGFIPASGNYLKIDAGDLKPGTYIFEVNGIRGKEVKLLIKK